jgi:hypothetical protein
MLTPPAGLAVYVATRPVDFRNYVERGIMQSPSCRSYLYSCDIKMLMLWGWLCSQHNWFLREVRSASQGETSWSSRRGSRRSQAPWMGEL